jgi:hypothetical protein
MSHLASAGLQTQDPAASISRVLGFVIWHHTGANLILTLIIYLLNFIYLF